MAKAHMTVGYAFYVHFQPEHPDHNVTSPNGVVLLRSSERVVGAIGVFGKNDQDNHMLAERGKQAFFSAVG